MLLQFRRHHSPCVFLVVSCSWVGLARRHCCRCCCCYFCSTAFASSCHFLFVSLDLLWCFLALQPFGDPIGDRTTSAQLLAHHLHFRSHLLLRRLSLPFLAESSSSIWAASQIFRFLFSNIMLRTLICFVLR